MLEHEYEADRERYGEQFAVPRVELIDFLVLFPAYLRLHKEHRLIAYIHTFRWVHHILLQDTRLAGPGDRFLVKKDGVALDEILRVGTNV